MPPRSSPIDLTLQSGCSIRRLTPPLPEGHFYFGYYDKSPYDATGKRVLANRVAFGDRMPTGDDLLQVGWIATDESKGTSEFVTVDSTPAWSWQQGTMLQWLGPDFGGRIIYNISRNNRFGARIHNLDTQATHDLPAPVYAVAPDGSYALGLNFARLARVRPGYGYEGVPDFTETDLLPANDGVWFVPLDGTPPRLICPLAEAFDLRPEGLPPDNEHWFNHAQINPDGSRLAVLHRWCVPGENARTTRLLTMNPDGSRPYVLSDVQYFSHYDWVDERHIIAWTRQPGIGNRYVLLEDESDRTQIIGEGILDGDGHMSLSPDGKWMLSDTMLNTERMRTLFLWRWPGGPKYVIGQFYSPPGLDGPLRVDLHPRWRRDGQAICIDSAHEGHRAMYEIDVTSIIGQATPA